MTKPITVAYMELRKAAEDCLLREDIADDELGKALSAALDEIKRIERTHYVAMAGLRGCLPNACSVHPDIFGAVDTLVDLCDRTPKAKVELEDELRLYRYADLDLHEDGNEYAEITECDCETPWIHDGTMTEQQWREEYD